MPDFLEIAQMYIREIRREWLCFMEQSLVVYDCVRKSYDLHLDMWVLMLSVPSCRLELQGFDMVVDGISWEWDLFE